MSPPHDTYRVGDDGSVWSSLERVRGVRGAKYVIGKEWKLKKPSCVNGYLSVALCSKRAIKRFRVNRLVLLAFVGPCPQGMESAHNNGVKEDNTLANLRWATKRENSNDKKLHGTVLIGERNPKCKLCRKIVEQIRSEYAGGTVSYRALARKYKITFAHAGRIIRGTNWAQS